MNVPKTEPVLDIFDDSGLIHPETAYEVTSEPREKLRIQNGRRRRTVGNLVVHAPSSATNDVEPV